ncbi:KilA-N domain-containing protein [Hymenobacter sp. YC55]|uniref:KilA-N domain-containing protein n=1 Tax=Hymenobacter sp. YC55 TaxID=3034019 RepID=UPI0023F67107|nr:KilA-N domain-containing protein [Hymenobacter sp. YC55]MDF7810925.1 KilA-N domain-containing protein [Hymenobacter sp. YC55]
MASSATPRIIICKNNDVITINDHRIHRDKDGRLSVTDIWIGMGRLRSNRPAIWITLPTTLGFLSATERFLKVKKSDLLVSTVGRGGGTYAHVQIALEYAQYLSPDLAVAVNQIFLERVEEEKNPDLILDRAEATYRRRGFTESQIRARFQGKATRNRLVTVLAAHGVRKQGYRLCTNATYTPLWGGPAAVIRQRKNLSEKANTREHMSEKELVALHLSELMAAESIEQKNARGNQGCAAECFRASEAVAKMLVAHTAGHPRAAGQ